MVAQRRFLPLVAVLALALTLIALRLVQVQVGEAEVWGQEAANLVRSSSLVPYHRGRITDRDGTVLAQDEDRYQVAFVYREFRRGHPLAQVAHARAALELRAVPLGEALAQLEPWAAALVAITPAQVSAFARGEALELAGVAVPVSADPEAEQRARRASDLRWYAFELLHASPREQRELRFDEDDPRRARPLLELVAALRKQQPDVLRAALAQELAAARAGLAELAVQLVGELAGLELAGDTPAERLVDALERQRRAIEDACADALFEEAAGFPAGRLSAETLGRAFDLDWLAALLRWDGARLASWCAGRRTRYEGQLYGLVVPRLLARAAVEKEQGGKHPAARLLDGLAELYAPAGERARDDRPRSWTELRDLAVLSELDGRFEDAAPSSDYVAAEAVLPLNDPELQALAETETDPWKLLGLATELAGAQALDPQAPASGAEASARWAAHARRISSDDPLQRRELGWLVRGLEARLGAAVDRALLDLCTREEGETRLRFARGRLDLVLQQEKSLVRDAQSRPVLLCEAPPYPLVHLLASDTVRFRGFEVRPTTRRRYLVPGADGQPVGRLIVGSVRKPSLGELFAQIRDERRYVSLRYQALRDRAEDAELTELAGRLFRPDEWTGGAGAEDYFDPELRGRFGWHELEGLAGRKALTLGQPPVDGQDVELTLDIAIQRAAEEVLAHPELPDDPQTDEAWFRNPIGAIVLLTVEGEVLAAASAPLAPGEPQPGRGPERSFVRERTLTMPTFNPPGSVFKPFVAAFALDRLGYDAQRSVDCAPLAQGDRVGGHGDLRCNAIHGACELERALQVSCNSYFAQLGERFSDAQLDELEQTFGFGLPSGLRVFGTQGRSGLREEARIPRPEAQRAARESASGRRRRANGLVYVQANPMQVARGLCGLATGWLPEVSLARAIGGERLPPRGEKLAIGEPALAFVRHAMELVVHAPGGSGYLKGLDEAALGFRLAAKTGSGDYKAFQIDEQSSASDRSDEAEGRVRKHTWLGGFFPVERPKAVVVVYLHDTARTASHTAVYVAAQFLRREPVRAWLARALEAERQAGEAR